MAERVRHSMRIVRLAAAFVTLLLVCTSFLSGCGYYRYAVLLDYDSFLAGFTKLPNPANSPEPVTFPVIDGFTPLFDVYFDYGQDFAEGGALAVENEVTYLLQSDGTRRVTNLDLFENTVYGERVVRKEGTLFGVYDLNGDEILPPVFERVESIGGTVLAVRGDIACALSAAGRAEKQFRQFAHLADENFILCDEEICDLQFNAQSVQGFAYMNVPSEGMVPVSHPQSGLIGYADTEGNIVIEPQFLRVEQFNEGSAVVEEEDYTNAVIDKSGKRLYRTDTAVLCSQYDGVRCFICNGVYGVMNADFEEILPPSLRYVKNERAYGHFLIVKRENAEGFYSLQTQAYEAFSFDDIEPRGDMFLCKTEDSYSILDCDLTVLTSNCDSLAYNGNVLTVRKNGKVAYYKKNA